MTDAQAQQIADDLRAARVPERLRIPCWLIREAGVEGITSEVVAKVLGERSGVTVVEGEFLEGRK